MDITIILPCFNEADNVRVIASELTPIVDRLRRDRSVEIVFVDDGSTDNTGDLLQKSFTGDPNASVIRHNRNRGLGAALRTGLRHAEGRIVVTTDSDGTYPFSLIGPLLAQLRPGIDIVTASCHHPLGAVDNVPRYRLILSRTASLMYRLLVDRNIHTFTCMFRAYRREVLETVHFESDGFLSVTELLVNARLMGYRVREMPCTLRVRRYGASKARVLGIIRSHLTFQWGLVWTRCSQLLRQPFVVAHAGPSKRPHEPTRS